MKHAIHCVFFKNVLVLSLPTSPVQAIVSFAGGWKLTGAHNASVSFDERVRTVHNKLGLNVFFTWGVIDHNKANRVAIIAGGRETYKR